MFQITGPTKVNTSLLTQKSQFTNLRLKIKPLIVHWFKDMLGFLQAGYSKVVCLRSVLCG